MWARLSIQQILDVRMALTPKFLVCDLVHHAQSFELFQQSITNTYLVHTTFISHHHSTNTRGGGGRGLPTVVVVVLVAEDVAGNLMFRSVNYVAKKVLKSIDVMELARSVNKILQYRKLYRFDFLKRCINICIGICKLDQKNTIAIDFMVSERGIV